ncbi:MAG: S-layer homology domain-containing protein, partial [Actinomycetota bacterium]
MTPRRLFLLPPALLLLLLLGVGAAGAVDSPEDDTDDGVSEDEGEEEDDSSSDEPDGSEEPIEPFDDTVDESYEQAVTALAEDGVIAGCEEDRFCPDQPLTRGQAASLLVSAFELEADEDEVSDVDFDDIAGTTHEDAINVLAANDYTQGCEESAFCPGDTLTRAQTASLLDRALDPPPADGPFFDDVSEPHEPAV